MSMFAREIATRLAGQLEGDADAIVHDVAPLERAGPSHITFVTNARLWPRAQRSAASCLVVPSTVPPLPERTLIRVPDPRAAFATVVQWFRQRPRPAPVVHPTAVVDATARIGDRTSIGPHCVVGANTSIGADCVLHANVTVYDGVTIGNRVIVHAGAVIGADGFGFVPVGERYEAFPQVGGVEIADDVEIGANSTIDRGALDSTRIGEGTKLDNLVHIAHNCVIGRHVVIAAQTGLAGGVVVGDRVVIGGQVGIADRARLEDGVVLGSASRVFTGKIVKAGEPLWGSPARPLRQHLKQMADSNRIGELREQVAALQRRLDELAAERRA